VRDLVGVLLVDASQREIGEAFGGLSAKVAARRGNVVASRSRRAEAVFMGEA
jgi:hypothetical protein